MKICDRPATPVKPWNRGECTRLCICCHAHDNPFDRPLFFSIFEKFDLFAWKIFILGTFLSENEQEKASERYVCTLFLHLDVLFYVLCFKIAVLEAPTGWMGKFARVGIVLHFLNGHCTRSYIKIHILFGCLVSFMWRHSIFYC